MATSSILVVWGQFTGIAAAILVSGYYLCRYGDAIAQKTTLGRTWVGAILLATVTSLPELAAGVSAVTVTDAPDLVAGELLGSCTFNLLLITLLDFMYRKKPVFTLADRSHGLTAAFGILLIGLAGIAVFTSKGLIPFSLGHLGWYSFVIPVFYFFAVRSLFESSSDGKPPTEPQGPYAKYSLAKVLFRYSLAAAVVVGGGIYLPVVAEQIVDVMGWNEAFVGTLFVAFTTSLPEAAVTISAISMGAVDLAFGNIVGSNLFNIVIFPICDFFYLKGPLLNDVADTHSVSAICAMAMSSLVIIGILSPPKRRILGLASWISFGIIAIYLVNIIVLFT